MQVLSPDFFLASMNTFLQQEKIPGLKNRACGNPSQPHVNNQLRWCGGRRIDYKGYVYYILPLLESEQTSEGMCYSRFFGVEIHKKAPAKYYGAVYCQKITSDPKYIKALDETNDDWQVVRQATTNLIIDVYKALKYIIKEDFSHEN